MKSTVALVTAVSSQRIINHNIDACFMDTKYDNLASVYTSTRWVFKSKQGSLFYFQNTNNWNHFSRKTMTRSTWDEMSGFMDKGISLFLLSRMINAFAANNLATQGTKALTSSRGTNLG